MKTIIRHFWRQRLFTLLNVVGLAIGISACWIMYRMVDYELSFDSAHPDAENIYQIVSRSKNPDGFEGGMAGISKGVLPFLLHQVSGLEQVVPMYYKYSETASIPPVEGEEPRLVEEPQKQVSTLASYFDLVPYKWLAGDPRSALDAPNKVVLTDTRSQQYFPGVAAQEALGKTILYDDSVSVIVSGIVSEPEYASSFDAQEFFPLETDDLVNENWAARSTNELLYVKLSAGGSPDQILQQLNAENVARNKKDFEEYNFKMWFEFLPLKEKHFAVEYGAQTRTANKKVLYGLIAVAGFLLALACINYINLSTAQLPQRAREIGIRKTLGSSSGKLIFRFLFETLLITVLAAVLSFFFSIFAVQYFKDFLPEGLGRYVNYSGLLAFGVLLILLITLLSGLYPAWLITRVETVNVLKGNVEQKIGGMRLNLRRGLIVFQFVVAQVFIIGAIIMGQQLKYSLNMDLGFNHQAVVTVEIPYRILYNDQFKGKQFLLKKNLEKHPQFVATALGDLPMSDNMMAQVLSHQSDTGKVQHQLMLKNIDADFIPLYGIELLAGENLHESDTTREYIINEQALKTYGFATPEEAIGKQLINYNGLSLPVTGVVRDFHQFNTKSSIGPVGFISRRENLGVLNIKLQPARPGTWQQAIGILESEWKQVYPGVPFQYKFYDDTIAALYEQEQRSSRLVGMATTITILISCLGLFGLATLTAYQRTKEIGIRKVLGASVAGVVRLLSTDFVKLVFIALLIASPIAWWSMNRWLEDFVYRIEIQWWSFFLAGFLAIIIALFTVSFQAVRAAVVNPVRSLRDE